MRDGLISVRESGRLLKQAFSKEYRQTFSRDLKAEVDFEKHGSLLEKRRMNHIVNELSRDAKAKKELETLKKAGYALTMESLGKSAAVRDNKNKVVVLARRASDKELQAALLREARSVAAVNQTLLKQKAACRG